MNQSLNDIMMLLVTIYKMFCCLMALYFAVIQYYRFMENEDASVINFKTFNGHSEDRYPDVSFCMKRGHFSNVVEEFTFEDEGYSESEF